MPRGLDGWVGREKLEKVQYATKQPITIQKNAPAPDHRCVETGGALAQNFEEKQ